MISIDGSGNPPAQPPPRPREAGDSIRGDTLGPNYQTDEERFGDEFPEFPDDMEEYDFGDGEESDNLKVNKIFRDLSTSMPRYL